MPKIERNTAGFSRMCVMISYVLVKILYWTVMPASAALVEGMNRLQAHPDKATMSTRVEMMATPPSANISSPPIIVPTRIDTNVPASISALPLINSSLRNWSGRIPYLTGPKNVDCAPIRNSMSIRKFALPRKNPVAAPIIRMISTNLMIWINLALSHLSAN